MSAPWAPAEALITINRSGVVEERTIHLDTADLILAFVESGLGWSLVPSLSPKGPPSRRLTAYPLVRFRAAVGLGFLGFYFFTQGQLIPALAVVAGSAGLYLSTVCVSLVTVLVVAAVGLAGMAGVAWHLITTT